MKDVAVQKARLMSVWAWSHSNEDFVRLQALGDILTAEDRAAGRAAPAYGYSARRVEQARVIVQGMRDAAAPAARAAALAMIDALREEAAAGEARSESRSA